MATEQTRFNGKRKRGRRPDPKNIIRRELNDEIRKVNKRLLRLNKHGYQGKWGAKTLFNRLDVVGGITTKGRTKLKLIKSGRELSVGDIKEIRKALSSFKNSQISTVKGIKKSEIRTKEVLKERMTKISDETGLPISEPSKKDIENMFNLLLNKDFQRLKDSGFISSDELIIELYNSRQKNYSPEEFMAHVEDIWDIPDQDIKDSLRRVYKAYRRL